MVHSRLVAAASGDQIMAVDRIRHARFNPMHPTLGNRFLICFGMMYKFPWKIRVNICSAADKNRYGIAGVDELMSKLGEVRRIRNATRYSLSGLQAAYQGEPAFRIEAWFVLLMLPFAFWLAESATQFALLLGSMVLVCVVELLNSAIEAVVDRVGPEIHQLSGRAKDMGSAAVFLTLIICALTWGAVVLDNYWR
jgi:diacylglycerol kinase (ATP)